jgi:hypothetical protein
MSLPVQPRTHTVTLGERHRLRDGFFTRPVHATPWPILTEQAGELCTLADNLHEPHDASVKRPGISVRDREWRFGESGDVTKVCRCCSRSVT